MNATVTIGENKYNVKHYPFTDSFDVSNSTNSTNSTNSKNYDLCIVGECKQRYDTNLTLSNLLSSNNLEKVIMAGDGACQFRALSHQLLRTEDKHMIIRERIVKYLSDNANLYKDFYAVDNNVVGVNDVNTVGVNDVNTVGVVRWDLYITGMTDPKTWGDNLTLQAFSDMLGYTIYILNTTPLGENPNSNDCSSSETMNVTKIIPRAPTATNGKPPLFLLFCVNHYDSVVPKQSNS